MKKTRDTPEVSKEEVERGIELRKGFMSAIQREITQSETQQAFCEKDSSEWKYHQESISILNRQRDNYGAR